MSLGVMFVQVLPKVRVTNTNPSSEPVKIVFTSFLLGPTEKMVPYTSGPFMSPVIGPPDGPSVDGSCRVRSGLRLAHVRPPSAETDWARTLERTSTVSPMRSSIAA